MGSAGLRKQWRKGDRFLIRHRDAAILVVEKTAGLLTHGRPSDRGTDRETLLGLLRRFGQRRGRGQLVLPVHRLDRPVSGLLVFARTPKARESLIADFAKKKVERRYIAAARGVLERDRGTFESWLKVDDPSLRVRSDPKQEGRGRRAVTHYRVLEHLAAATLVEVQLETGVRNQIRVHFAEAGFPLLGERAYDPEVHTKGRFRGQRSERIFLHAARLGFRHPTTGEDMVFESDLPADLEGWVTRLRRESKHGHRSGR